MHLVFIRLQPPFPCVVKQEIKMTLKLKNKKNFEKVSFSSFDIYSPFEK